MKTETLERENGFANCYSDIKISDVLQSDELGKSRKEAGFILLDGLLGLG